MNNRRPKPLKRGNKRSYKEIFLAKLKELSGSEQKVINNLILRKALEWEKERYDRVKDALAAEKTINAGLRGGREGAISLAESPGSKIAPALKVFISYSHVDEEIKNNLVKHLAPLKRIGLIVEWHDRKIDPGDKWEQVISQNLRSADIIILLVSVDFINSQYCYDIEMETALDRSADGKAVIVPVIARSCMWKSTKFASFQALPTDGRAIDAWKSLDEPLTIVAEGIKIVAERLLNQQ